MSKLDAALAAASISLKKYDPTKTRPVYLPNGSVTVGKFSEILRTSLGKKLIDYPEVILGTQDPDTMTELLREHADEHFESDDDSSGEIITPKELEGMTLNVDTSSNEGASKRYFCTDEEEFVSEEISGTFYIEICDLSLAEAARRARKVVPRYMPRAERGITLAKNPITGAPQNLHNSYIPAHWDIWRRRNPIAWKKLPAKPPALVMKLLKHVIPSAEERGYFYAWAYESIVRRSYVYLVLCGAPGVGKNRIKLLMRALHGVKNSADGKKETLGANQSKFNSQMENNTLIWFDELKYGPDMEPRMKEYQNDSASIEKKGEDATRSTEIHCSMVISNNYPRDNYILFNSRKFAPLVLGDGPLTNSMTSDEIAELSRKLEDKTRDDKFVAQIAKWILSIGEKYSAKWPNLEYQGPKYWELAHTSMSRWQKIAILTTTIENDRGPFRGWNPVKKAFLWSEVEEGLRKKKEYESKDYRDATTVKSFFETYRDIKGQKVFEVEDAGKGVMQDFWIRPINGLEKKNIAFSLNKEDGGSLFLGTEEEESKLKKKETKESVESIPKQERKKLERPRGISNFQWRKMKAEWEAANGDIENEDDKDLL